MAQCNGGGISPHFRNAIYSVTLDQNKFFFQNKVDCEFIYYNSNIKTFIYTAIIQKVGSW